MPVTKDHKHHLAQLSHSQDIPKKISAGDNDLFKRIYDNYYKLLVLFATRLVKNTFLAEDIVQEVMLNLWRKKESLHIHSDLKSYLMVSVKNQVFNHHRKGKKRSDINIELASRICSFYCENSDTILYNELQQNLEKAIDKLPARTKEIFNKSRVDDKNYKEIAREENMTIQGVGFHISKALKFLRNELKEYLCILMSLSL